MNDLLKGTLRRGLDRPAPHLVRIHLHGQVQIRIERMQAVDASGSVTGALDSHLSKNRLQPSFVKVFLIAHHTVGALYGLGRLPRAPYLQVGLQKLPHQFTPTLLQFPLHIAVGHTARLLGPEKSLQAVKLCPRFRKTISHSCGLSRHLHPPASERRHFPPEDRPAPSWASLLLG
jgi:hypothetical protein